MNMSKKKDRINALISLHKALETVEHDAENQTAELIKENMGNFKECVKKVLSLDGIGFLSVDD